MNDLISVIVPVYKVEKYLNKCIDSIINQTYKNLEIILIDDGSPDNCGKICDEYAKKDKRINVMHKENGGVSSARNAGISSAQGKWISFIDADDWVEANFLEVMYKTALKNSADIALCGYNRIYNTHSEKINVCETDKTYNSREYLIKSLNPQTGFGFCHMKLIRKECLNNLKFNENLVVGEDAQFNIKLSQNINKAVFCRQALYNYRNNSESVVKKYDSNYANKYLESMKDTKAFINQNYNNDDEIKQNYYNFVAFHVMLIAVNYCYHPENPIKERKKLLKNICNYDEFKEGIKKSNFANISFQKKIALFTLKFRLYFIMELICKVRQRKNK